VTARAYGSIPTLARRPGVVAEPAREKRKNATLVTGFVSARRDARHPNATAANQDGNCLAIVLSWLVTGV